MFEDTTTNTHGDDSARATTGPEASADQMEVSRVRH